MSRFTTEREREIQEGVAAILSSRLRSGKIILFGSRSKKHFSPHSDFDFAVDANRPDPKTERMMREEIEKIAGLYRVDVTYLRSVDEEFRDLVLRTGTIIDEKRG